MTTAEDLERIERMHTLLSMHEKRARPAAPGSAAARGACASEAAVALRAGTPEPALRDPLGAAAGCSLR